MQKTALENAKSLMNQRNFCLAIELLESKSELYKNDFDYYVTLGTACLYSGEFGNAARYFNTARSIKLNDTTLYLGQAVLLLRAGKTDKAVSYYLDILTIEPENKTALKALDFLKEHGDYDTICHLIETGKIAMFYPPLGFNPLPLFKSAAIGLCFGLLFFAGFVVFTKLQQRKIKIASFNPELLLSSIEKQHPTTPISNADDPSPPRYMLDDKDILNIYEKKALVYWQSGQKENSCRIELNRILLSNASMQIKQKANLLLESLHPLNFEEALKDNIDFLSADAQPFLYEGCFANWLGRISQKEDAKTGYILTVGDTQQKQIQGMSPIYLSGDFTQKINMGQPLRVLVRLTLDKDDKLLLDLQEFYQPKDPQKL